MKNRVKFTALFAIFGLFLTACSTTAEQCDPSKELSLIGKMSCDLGGHYDQRIEQKEQTLAAEKATNKELNNIYSLIQEQQRSVNASTAKKKQQLAKLNKSVNTLTANLKQKAAGKEDLLNQINEVQKQMASVNNSSASEAAKQAELKKLQDKLIALQKVMGL
ncbi:hypothetical protein [Glaesserella sp.]|uniref:hypothetical protein n=1 Tax=Glaesserella sp. TaxID=2094731 RepID=UPI0035A04B91